MESINNPVHYVQIMVVVLHPNIISCSTYKSLTVKQYYYIILILPLISFVTLLKETVPVKYVQIPIVWYYSYKNLRVFSSNNI